MAAAARDRGGEGGAPRALQSLPVFVVWGLMVVVYGRWFLVSGFWFMIYGLWCMAYSLGLRVQGWLLFPGIEDE